MSEAHRQGGQSDKRDWIKEEQGGEKRRLPQTNPYAGMLDGKTVLKKEKERQQRKDNFRPSKHPGDTRAKTANSQNNSLKGP